MTTGELPEAAQGTQRWLALRFTSLSGVPLGGEHWRAQAAVHIAQHTRIPPAAVQAKGPTGRTDQAAYLNLNLRQARPVSSKPDVGLVPRPLPPSRSVCQEEESSACLYWTVLGP